VTSKKGIALGGASGLATNLLTAPLGELEDSPLGRLYHFIVDLIYSLSDYVQSIILYSPHTSSAIIVNKTATVLVAVSAVGFGAASDVIIDDNYDLISGKSVYLEGISISNFNIEFTSPSSKIDPNLFDPTINLEVRKLNELATMEFLKAQQLGPPDVGYQPAIDSSIRMFDQSLLIEPDNPYALLIQGFAISESNFLQFSYELDNMQRIVDANYDILDPNHSITGFALNALGDANMSYAIELHSQSNMDIANEYYNLALLNFEKSRIHNPEDMYAFERINSINYLKTLDYETLSSYMNSNVSKPALWPK